MKFITVKAKQKFIDGICNQTNENGDICGYGTRCYTYAMDWANLMEQQMSVGKKLVDVADQCSDDADTDGITGFMYGAATQILAATWIYGEELRRWHNLKTQFNNEGEKANESSGVLNVEEKK